MRLGVSRNWKELVNDQIKTKMNGRQTNKEQKINEPNNVRVWLLHDKWEA